MSRLGYAVSSLGTVISLYGIWVIIKGPLLGLQTPSHRRLALATILFVVGVLIILWGYQRVVKSRKKIERPDPEDVHDPTMSWIRR